MSYETDDKMVSHPDHYQSGKYEVIDIIEEFTKDLSGIEAVDTANAIKYVLRWHKKNGVQDIKKAIWYLTNLVEHLEEKEKPIKPHSVVIHKVADGNYVIEDIKDDEMADLAKDFIEDVSKVEDQLDDKEEVHTCGTCEWQYSSVMCPRAKDIMSGASDTCFDEAIACEKWLSAEAILNAKKIDDEKSELSVECHTNAAGVTVPDSQPWSSSNEPHNCITCVYRLRKSNLEPCKSCEKYINWTPKEQAESEEEG